MDKGFTSVQRPVIDNNSRRKYVKKGFHKEADVLDRIIRKAADPGRTGTVSHGTLKSSHLGPAFLAELKDVDPSAYTRILKNNPGIEDWGENEWESENADYLINETLIDALNDAAPEGHYFGAHPGDGSDFGYWPNETP